MESYLDGEMAGIVRLAMQCDADAVPYFWKMPEDFQCPSVYFPVPEQSASLSALHISKTTYHWYVKFFAIDTVEAYKMASAALNKMAEARFQVQIYDKGGSLTEKKFLVKTPEIKSIAEGVVQMHLSWERYRGCDQEVGTVSTDIVIEGIYSNQIIKEGN